MEVMADGSAPQLAPSFFPPALEPSGSLPSTSHTLEVPAATANLDGLSARSLIPPVPHNAVDSTAANSSPTSDDGTMDRTPPRRLSSSGLPESHTRPMAVHRGFISSYPFNKVGLYFSKIMYICYIFTLNLVLVNNNNNNNNNNVMSMLQLNR